MIVPSVPTTSEMTERISSPMYPRNASIAFSEICISSSGSGTKNVCSTFAACAATRPPIPSASNAANAPMFLIRMFMTLKTVPFREFKHSTGNWRETNPQIFGKY